MAAIAFAAMLTVPGVPARADTFRDEQWYLSALKVAEAQSISKGAGVTVAVVDTGSYPHPDVRLNLLTGINVTAGASGNGQVDQDGHGTNMAAIIAAHGRNGSDGVLGIAPSAKILPVKIVNSGKRILPEPMAKGIEWATSQKAKVINISAGTGPIFALIDAVGAAIDADIVVVASVGNKSTDPIISYPAAIDGVLVVGATGRNGQHASLSTASSKVQICAPGIGIATAQPKNKYVSADGTSPSAAIVSGAVALVRAKFPRLSGPDVINRLTATADDIGPPGRDDECGFGRLNIVKALTADVPPLEGSASSAPSSAVTTPPTAAPTATSTATVAAPEAEPSSSSTPLLLGGLVGLLAAGGVLAFFVARRRRNF